MHLLAFVAGLSLSLALASPDITFTTDEDTDVVPCGQDEDVDCVDITQCPTAMKQIEFGHYSTPCGFKGNQPYVCCKIPQTLDSTYVRRAEY